MDANETSVLLQQADKFQKEGYYSKAIPIIEKVVALQREAFGRSKC
jgi:hypothetical protein